jgi:hypothetical protein
MKSETFIHDFYSNNYKFENVADYLDNIIEEYVINNTIETNKEIITEFIGDIYESLKLYNKFFGNVHDLYKKPKEFFYQQLAYIALFVYLYSKINE